ncbi:UDP-sugar transporter sqv-7 [Porphyridium purpureum]|uniref:UDP-sugar transporter sqv-7 n=1 Tax=Porphyridium purpureum TaxID=35688 RepID=A0A5J4Z425_PORPP|nr:UDP-sugar transporter sqv-7 [Porphyridium purpureum]|eukprot:POR1220..scf295_1
MVEQSDAKMTAAAELSARSPRKSTVPLYEGRTTAETVVSDSNAALQAAARRKGSDGPLTGSSPRAHALESGKKVGHSTLYSLFVLVLFNSVSVGAVFINKALLHLFNRPLTIYTSQAVTTISLVVLLRLVGFLPEVRISRTQMIQLIPCSLCNWCNVMVGLWALGLVNIPMFSTLRRLTVIFTMMSEMIELHKYPSLYVAIAVLIIAIGSVISGLSDATFSLLGYVLVFANNSFTAMYLVLIKKAMDRENPISPFVLSLYLFSFNLVPNILIWVGSGEAKLVYQMMIAKDDVIFTRPEFFPLFLSSSLSAFAITFCSVLATSVTSPLTTVVSAQAKNALQSVLGMLTKDYIPNPVNVLGLGVALIGQFMFGWAKYRENR